MRSEAIFENGSRQDILGPRRGGIDGIFASRRGVGFYGVAYEVIVSHISRVSFVDASIMPHENEGLCHR